MRSFSITVLAVAVLFAAANVATATPEEEIAQLKAQVAALKQQLLELKGQIAELKFEVETLKAAGGSHEAVPVAPPVVPPIEGPRPPVIVPPVNPPVAPPAIPAVPGAPGSAVGAYDVDPNVLADAMYQMMMQQYGAQLQAATPEQRAQFEQMMKQQIQAQAQAMKISLELKADNTWTLGVSAMGQQQSYGGTWTQDGSTITFTQTTENGQPSASPDRKTGTFADGKITLEPDADMPMKLVLNRR